MSYRITVKTVVNGKERVIDLQRGTLSLEILKSEILRKTQQKGQWHMRVGTKTLNNDNDLIAVVVEAEKNKERFLTVDIVGGQVAKPTVAAVPSRPSNVTAAAAAVPTTATNQPKPRLNTSNPPTQPVTVQPTRPAPPQVVQDSGVFTTFVVSGVPYGAEKADLKVLNEGKNYVFQIVPAKSDVTVEVAVAEKNKLVFKFVTGTSAVAKTFNMPFEISVTQLEKRGDDIVFYNNQ